MTKAYSLAFKQKMVERLTGKNALSPSALGREIGVRQHNLSRWLHEARSLPAVASNTPKVRVWTVWQKAQVLADAAKLNGEELTSYLEREGIKLADFERWRIALEEDGGGSIWWQCICEEIVAAVNPPDDREDDICANLICLSGIGFDLTPAWDDDEIRELSE